MADVAQLHRRASEVLSAKVERLGPDVLGNPTPCAEWDVRALLNHLVNESLWVPPLVDGATVAEVGDRFDGDLLGDDVRASWSAAAEPACAALEGDGVMERIVHLSFGDVPGEEYAKQLTVDLVVHGWDLARGAGLDDTIETELAEACLAWGSEWKPMLASASDYFDPPIEPPSGADTQTQLINLFGRRP